eukprot:jgi/Tetstr1/450137/TSEL_037179.t1
MGGSARQRPTKPKRKGKTKVKQRDVASPEVLYERAQDALTREEYETALSLLKTAVELDPNNTEINDAYGCLLAECGQTEEAVAALRRSVTVSPNAGHEKYLYLGQLLAGQEAVNAVAKGVEILEHQLHQMAGDADEWDTEEIAEELSRALCSQAELLLNGSQEVDAVGLEVESLLARASDIDGSNPEPWQVLCSLRVEQGRPDEALAMLRKSIGLWFTARAHDSDTADGDGEQAGEEVPEGGSADEDSDMDEDGEDDNTPSYEFRIETVKLLLELDETTDQALEIIVRLLSENDSVPDTWHLYAMCLHASGQFDDALKAVEDGRMVCKKMGMPQDDVVMQSFAELQESIQASF